MKEELEALILNLTTNFEKAIPENESEKKEIVVAFRNHLYLAVRTILESTSKFISKDLESIKSVLNRIASDFNEKDLVLIKRTLLEDGAFEEIRKKSIGIFEIAKKAMSGKRENLGINMETEIENMQDLLKNVRRYNQKQAQELISEAIVDLEYITHSNEDNLSFRVYQFKERMKSIGVER